MFTAKLIIDENVFNSFDLSYVSHVCAIHARRAGMKNIAYHKKIFFITRHARQFIWAAAYIHIQMNVINY